jgi:hypothetical protein
MTMSESKLQRRERGCIHRITSGRGLACALAFAWAPPAFVSLSLVSPSAVPLMFVAMSASIATAADASPDAQASDPVALGWMVGYAAAAGSARSAGRTAATIAFRSCAGRSRTGASSHPPARCRGAAARSRLCRARRATISTR